MNSLIIRDNDKKIDIVSLKLKELEDCISDLGEKPFRAKQIYSWLHEKLIWDFNEMTNLSKDLREKLEGNFYIPEAKIVEKLVSQDKTVKYLFRLKKDTIIESVLMRHSFGNTVCVSSQAGCDMGCEFCFSTKDGKERDLDTSEILAQVYMIEKDLGERISNVVIMGSGEPLLNYDNVMDFIDILSSEEGLNIGSRKITLSTCGIVDRIYELADRQMQINLAISLHAPKDSIRKEIMPIARTIGLDKLMEACDYYVEKTGRRITYEYALMKGINDSVNCAHSLANLLRGRLAHINLIPVNPIEDGEFKKPSEKSIEEFGKILESRNMTITIRRELGSDISAACGQLRGKYRGSGIDS